MDDPLLLSRIQFAANISFHILFPTINIALAWLLAWFKIRSHYSHDQAWIDSYRFCVKIFAVTFALGVVSGITMSFQFGTNWPGFMTTVDTIAGPLLAGEVLTAFFLEAGFLGIMLFGRRRVSNTVHTAATILVAVGTTLSAFWILALNSWMHTPDGYVLEAGKIIADDWWSIIFNPSMPYRFTHMLLASGLTTAFFVAGLAAYRVLRGDNSESNALALRTAITLAAVLIPVQIFVGDQHGLNTLEHQPAKIAAMEATWHRESAAPLVLFALPDEQARVNRYEISIPYGASLILTHDPHGELPGLEEFNGDHPPVTPVFFAFRTMVGCGVLMLLIAWWCKFSLWKGRKLTLAQLRILVATTFIGWIATLAGWYVTEIGRQPWLVHGLLRTEQAVTTTPAAHIGLSLGLYLAIYVGLVLAYVSVVFLMARRAAYGDRRREADRLDNPFRHPQQEVS
ncbi:MAG: cytochrome ubiquinol oxidase subunit I [Lysobacteraceae bacterium]|nr:MAG: cytochrome ubiquinol oxidase subunit I [Xanthomonadaceae bacterium]